MLSLAFLNGDLVRCGCTYKNLNFIRAERQSGNDLETMSCLNGTFSLSVTICRCVSEADKRKRIIVKESIFIGNSAVLINTYSTVFTKRLSFEACVEHIGPYE